MDKKGFTLVELLVTISIIAILATIGLVIFGNVQRGARDAKRRSDIDAIVKAMEVYKDTSASTYKAMAAALFASGDIPIDTGGRVYCEDHVPPGTLDAEPAGWTTATCPANYATIANLIPPAGTTSWRFCTSLENDGVTPIAHCVTNQQ